MKPAPGSRKATSTAPRSSPCAHPQLWSPPQRNAILTLNTTREVNLLSSFTETEAEGLPLRAGFLSVNRVPVRSVHGAAGSKPWLLLAAWKLGLYDCTTTSLSTPVMNTLLLSSFAYMPLRHVLWCIQVWVSVEWFPEQNHWLLGRHVFGFNTWYQTFFQSSCIDWHSHDSGWEFL